MAIAWRAMVSAALVATTVLFGPRPARADSRVVINELCAAPSDRLLRNDASSTQPHLGTGLAWYQPGFDDHHWLAGLGPVGFGYPNLETDVRAAMDRTTPSLYLRSVFHVTAEELESETPVHLQVNYDDGFVAYLNGREIARANLGPRDLFIPAVHPAFNRHIAVNPEVFPAGAASVVLRQGLNVLALQVHNTWPTSGLDCWDSSLVLDARHAVIASDLNLRYGLNPNESSS